MRLFSNRSQRMSKCGKNISDALGRASCATFLFLPHFDVLCDLLLNRRMAAWNLFVKYKLWASRRCVISHPWHIITRLQCTFSFISCHVGSWWKLMSDDNSLLKCHLRQIIQSVNGCFKFVIFIKTNAHFMVSDPNDFIFSLRCTASLARPNEKSGNETFEKKRKKLYPPSFMVYDGVRIFMVHDLFALIWRTLGLVTFLWHTHGFWHSRAARNVRKARITF